VHLEAVMENILSLFEEYKAAWQTKEPDFARCQKLMMQLKLLVSVLAYPAPAEATAGFEQSKTVSRELYLTREMLEYAVLLAVSTRDEAAFERSMVQLKAVYADYGRALPESARQPVLLGLWLLFLLTENRIGDFHAELELLPRLAPGLAGSAGWRYVAFVVELEQAKMEGRYTRLWQAPSRVPAEAYAPFTEKLITTARHDIADALEVAYERLARPDAAKLLGLRTDEELQRFALERHWRLDGDGLVSFQRSQPPPQLDALQLIADALRYANELERII